jgi:hypothetical protein
LKLTFRNVSSRSIHLLGFNDICTRWGCLSAVGLPTEIPASALRDVVVKLKTVPKGFSGPFSQDATFYTDSHAHAHISLRVSGRVARKANGT